MTPAKAPRTASQPVSSLTSRRAAASALSPASSLPFGRTQSWCSGRCATARRGAPCPIRQTIPPAALMTSSAIVTTRPSRGAKQSRGSCRCPPEGGRRPARAPEPARRRGASAALGGRRRGPAAEEEAALDVPFEAVGELAAALRDVAADVALGAPPAPRRKAVPKLPEEFADRSRSRGRGEVVKRGGGHGLTSREAREPVSGAT